MKKYFIPAIFIIISLSIIVIMTLKINLVSPFSSNTGLYFYSALIQANAAIFSIVGVFYIFRLQSINSAISEIYYSLYNENAAIRGFAQSFRNMTIEQKEEKMKNWNQGNDIEKEYKKWLHYEKELRGIKHEIILPLIILAILIVIEAVFLLLSDGIHNLGFSYEISSLGFVLIFQAYILFTIVVSIIKIIREKQNE